MALGGYTGVKVFSATKARDRDALGDQITTWLRANPIQVVEKVVRLSSDAEFHCMSITIFYTQAAPHPA